MRVRAGSVRQIALAAAAAAAADRHRKSKAALPIILLVALVHASRIPQQLPPASFCPPIVRRRVVTSRTASVRSERAALVAFLSALSLGGGEWHPCKFQPHVAALTF